uniref:polymeric immunoglobulin receptor-like n=1 Tax=Maylandia zebra TaxID=106582 RepID=UPI000D30C44C|nr:polymeric immunoglobulin receptor-like [Maylandia zebra]
MALCLRIIYIITGLTGVHSITTVSKVSVKTGKSISIPCLYESKYRNHVKYFCEGAKWRSCNDVVKTNTADPSGKYSISDDKNQFFFTVTINNLTNENTDYWCVVEINNGPDYGEHFQLSVTSGTPSLYVDHQMITGYIGESITIRCHHSNSGEMKWCRLGRNCVTGSSGSIDGTTVTTYMSEPNVFTVTMSGLQSEDSGWYWCAKGDIQIPVYLTVTEKPITTTAHTCTGDGTVTTLKNKQQRASFDLKILIIRLSVLIFIVIVVLFIWLILRHKQRKADSSATAMVDQEVIYANVGNIRSAFLHRRFPMAAHLIVLFLFSVKTGVHSTTVVSKVSVKAGKSISIPCFYHYQYRDHVKYLCKGYFWRFCKYAVKTNEADPLGKYLISDDKKEQIFTVTINHLTNQNTDYWCGLKNTALDNGVYFQLLVTNGTPSLYVDHQRITGYIGENITIRCHHSNSGEMKWCRLGRNCVTGSSGSIDGTTVTAHISEPNVFTVTMSGLGTKDSGWYWCAEGDIQIPVYLTVTENTTTTPTTTGITIHTVNGNGKFTTMEQWNNFTIVQNRQHRASFPSKILIIPLSVLIVIVIVVLFIWFILRHKQSKAESSATAMVGEEVTYSEVRTKKKRLPKSSFAESDMELVYSSVVEKQRNKRAEGKETEVTYSTLANLY